MKKLLTLLLCLCLVQVQAQTHTFTHNFKFILSSGPGSGSDMSLEIYAPCLRKQNINVLKEFKPGAEGLIAMNTLIQAQDTNNTTNILLGNFGLNMLSKFPNIDLLQDINPITYLNSSGLVFVGKNGKYNSLSDVINEKKIINIGTSAPSSTFLAETLFKELKIPYQIIPYKNSINGLTDIINGSLDLFVDTHIGARPLVEAEKINIVVSTFDKDTAKKFNHDSIEKYSTMLSKMHLGLILSVNPALDKTAKNMVVQSIHACGRDIETLQKLEKINSRPIFISTDELIRIIKLVSGK